MTVKCPKCHTENSDSTKFCGECGTQIASSESISEVTKTIQTPLTSPSKIVAGKYKILTELGRGGMGIVYKAKDTKLKRNVALKFLPAELTKEKDAKKRFIQEAQAAAALNHPNICIIHEVDEVDDQTFIAMEYIEGQTLKDKIESGPLEINEAVKIVTHVAEGLGEAHAKGIIHRDIKPANIMLTDKGTAKIMDFGIAKLEAGVDMTKTSTLIGTVAYMSPEQARGEDVDHRTDIWSLGAMFYEMLTNERPFRKSQEHALIFEILEKDPHPVTSLRQDLPSHIEKVVEKALSKKLSNRYQNVHEIIQKLKQPPSLSLPREENSIAVLPFEDMSPAKDQEYFCDGISEEIINRLTQIKDFRVIARTSAFAFKGKQEDIREIGRKLDVEKMLEGSVRKSGQRIRITAQLINVTDSSHLWSKSFNREMEDIFAIQDEISLAIVDKLKIKLLGKEKQGLVKRHADNQEAYSFYLKARYFFNKLNPGGFEKAIENFEQAIEKDPNNAAAFAGLADSYWYSSIWGNLPPHQTYPKAREAAKKAIEIDDTLGEAHASLASIHTFYDWNWEAAEREFKRALELTPGSSYTYVYYSFYLNLRRRYDEAIIQARKAQELDPVSGFCNTNLGHRLWQARRYDEAIEEFQKWLVIEPNDWFAHHHLGELYLGKSMIKEAIVEIDKSVELSGGVPLNIAIAVMAHYRFGDKKVAERLFDNLKKRASHEYIPPMCFVYIYLVRGEADQAFEWVKKAYEERDGFFIWHRISPMDCWQFPSDPRIDELLDRLGLP